jgi:hypothetical protein
MMISFVVFIVGLFAVIPTSMLLKWTSMTTGCTMTLIAGLYTVLIGTVGLLGLDLP